MEHQTPESKLPSSSLAFRRLPGNCGEPNRDHRDVLSAATAVYKAAADDIVLQPAAFGIAVSIISNNLEVNIRAAALILCALLDIQPGE